MYLVMEYLPGGSLRALLHQRGRLPVDDAAHIAADVCDGLTVAQRWRCSEESRRAARRITAYWSATRHWQPLSSSPSPGCKIAVCLTKRSICWSKPASAPGS